MANSNELDGKKLLITGCSGGGKSTLLAALAAKGHATITEPGLRIVKEELAGTGNALPWVDMQAFARRAIELSRADLASVAGQNGYIFFDRGLIDAAVALHFSGGDHYRETLGETRHYARQVFFAPPWPEIFVQDKDRRHDFDAAIAESKRLQSVLSEVGYDILSLPKTNVDDRVGYVLRKLSLE